MNETIQAIEMRSSTRSYTDEKLTQEELDILIKAGLQAPTAANRQEIFFTVIDGKNPILQEIEDEKNRLNGSAPQTNFYYNAPTVIIISADKAMHWGFHDAGIAVENIALAAEALGLGSVIIGCIEGAMKGEKEAYFNSALKLPENYEYSVAIALGHKAASKEPHTFEAEKQVAYI